MGRNVLSPPSWGPRLSGGCGSWVELQARGTSFGGVKYGVDMGWGRKRGAQLYPSPLH